MKISLVIPAYNEEKRLGPFLKTVAAYVMRHRSLVHEVIVVDDGSRDRTARVAQRWQPQIGRLKVIRHEVNKGKGAAVRTGVMASSGDAVVFIDADGATPIAELPKMVEALRQADIGVGNRWMRGAKTARHSALRRLSGTVYRWYMWLFGLGKVDTMCGFKGYRSAAARSLFRELLEDRWLFDTEVAYRAVRQGWQVVNFPIRWESKDGSKLSTRTLIASAFKIWPLIRRIKKQEKK